MCWLFWVSLWKIVSIYILCRHGTQLLCWCRYECVSLALHLSHSIFPFSTSQNYFFRSLSFTPPPFFFTHTARPSCLRYIYGSINIMPLIICAYQHVPHACGCGHQVRFINTVTLDLTITDTATATAILLLLLLLLLSLLLYFDFIRNVKLIQCWYVLQCMLAFSFTLTLKCAPPR